MSFEEPSRNQYSNDFGESNDQQSRWSSLWLAWIAIIASLLLAILPHFIGGKQLDDEPSIFLQEIYAKYLVGLSNLSFAPKDNFRDVISTIFEKGPARQRLIGTVLIGEFDGPKASLESLQQLDRLVETKAIAASPSDTEVLHLLLKMQQSRMEKRGVESELTVDEHQRLSGLLTERLGWAGKLALVPAESADRLGRSTLLGQARRTMFAMVGVVAFVIMATICGVALQITWWVFAATGRLNSGIGKIRGDYVVYAETFALWMLLYVALSRLISLPFLWKWGMVTILIPQIGSLSALAWPVIRGLRWDDVRQDVGLTLGRKPWTLPLVGVGTYVSAQPVIITGALVMLAMMAVATKLGLGSEEAAAPIHPIVEPILRGNWTSRLQVLLVVVFAAVPEEIMFRGVFYRHLRELAARFGYVASVLFAALISSFIFAAIHPQGLYGIPMLMGLAIVFALAREWRGTLIPSMIAHAMVNAATSSILFLIAD